MLYSTPCKHATDTGLMIAAKLTFPHQVSQLYMYKLKRQFVPSNLINTTKHDNKQSKTIHFEGNVT